MKKLRFQEGGQKHSFAIALRCYILEYVLCINYLSDGARKKTRTSMTLRSLAPEASASTNSAIRAWLYLIYYPYIDVN